MKFGAHVSAAGGLWNAPLNAKELGCETYQIFSRPPQGGPAPKLTKELIQQFRKTHEECGFKEFVIHAPYFINFASATPRIRHGSVAVVRDELERGSLLGAASVMFHPGSAKDMGEKEAHKATIEGIKEVLKGYKGSTQLLIEISAGSGMVMGDNFEEIAMFLDKIKVKKLGVCFDTQHAFASGYDLRTKAAVDATVKKLDATIGLERVPMTHCNDSKVELNGKKDRHEHLGEGHIGLDGFKALVQHPKLKHWLFQLETPWDDALKKDLALLKKFRDG
ncbi:deoxyribonuclease IV [Patescibacteria group bacterium]|nr:MAG: deoxyribonuclease IV [Patescibacteria group bacterium]